MQDHLLPPEVGTKFTSRSQYQTLQLKMEILIHLLYTLGHTERSKLCVAHESSGTML